MKKLVLAFSFCFAALACNSQSSDSEVKTVEENPAYPQPISCEMALDTASESYSCNDFTVKNLYEKKLIGGACLFAGDGELEVKVYSRMCDQEAATSICEVEDDFTKELVPTYYYVNNDEQEKLAKESCDKMQGMYTRK